MEDFNFFFIIIIMIILASFMALLDSKAEDWKEINESKGGSYAAKGNMSD